VVGEVVLEVVDDVDVEDVGGIVDPGGIDVETTESTAPPLAPSTTPESREPQTRSSPPSSKTPDAQNPHHRLGHQADHLRHEPHHPCVFPTSVDLESRRTPSRQTARQYWPTTENVNTLSGNSGVTNLFTAPVTPSSSGRSRHGAELFPLSNQLDRVTADDYCLKLNERRVGVGERRDRAADREYLTWPVQVRNAHEIDFAILGCAYERRNHTRWTGLVSVESESNCAANSLRVPQARVCNTVIILDAGCPHQSALIRIPDGLNTISDAIAGGLGGRGRGRCGR